MHNKNDIEKQLKELDGKIFNTYIIKLKKENVEIPEKLSDFTEKELKDYTDFKKKLLSNKNIRLEYFNKFNEEIQKFEEAERNKDVELEKNRENSLSSIALFLLMKTKETAKNKTKKTNKNKNRF